MVALQRFQALSRVILHADENNHTFARALGKQMVGRRLSQIEAKGLLAKFDRH
jgi:hypothetical protein